MRNKKDSLNFITSVSFYAASKRVYRAFSVLVCFASIVVFVVPLFVGIRGFPPWFFIRVAILLTLSVYELILVTHRSVSDQSRVG